MCCFASGSAELRYLRRPEWRRGRSVAASNGRRDPLDGQERSSRSTEQSQCDPPGRSKAPLFPLRPRGTWPSGFSNTQSCRPRPARPRAAAPPRAAPSPRAPVSPRYRRRWAFSAPRRARGARWPCTTCTRAGARRTWSTSPPRRSWSSRRPRRPRGAVAPPRARCRAPRPLSRSAGATATRSPRRGRPAGAARPRPPARRSAS
mmetsp:Transcript_12485/g.38499  ORF Transcript_12485/g.38499 Transcript_12485/m.38499 type:complete len:204 (-) Transcript_12485:1600-2211(-)